ncbi:GlyGly-CTERM sorting domain-containing protein [Aeromonas schubertii]|uniref:GlyGly-CTERM sorting domain-containing protein n=1 Tax=Aeromonas schubertii TaxID=652 RepID=UPI00118745BC|nr:GlyGly-CTERM sorting domain-containing protein [Aeromonas schubertii]
MTTPFCGQLSGEYHLHTIKVPDDSYGWRDFKVVNRSGNTAELSDVNTTAPGLDNQCPRTLAAGAECTIRVRFDGKYTVGTVRSEKLTLNSTIAGVTTPLEAYLIGTTLKAEPVTPSQPVQPPSVEPVPQPEQPISQPAQQPAAASSGGNGGGGGGAFGLAGLLLVPLAWLRRRV